MIEKEQKHNTKSPVRPKYHNGDFLRVAFRVLIAITLIGSISNLFEISGEIFWHEERSIITLAFVFLQIFFIIYCTERLYFGIFDHFEKLISALLLLVFFHYLMSTTDLIVKSGTTNHPHIVFDIVFIFYIVQFIVFIYYSYEILCRFKIWIGRKSSPRQNPDKEPST